MIHGWRKNNSSKKFNAEYYYHGLTGVLIHDSTWDLSNAGMMEINFLYFKKFEKSPRHIVQNFTLFIIT